MRSGWRQAHLQEPLPQACLPTWYSSPGGRWECERGRAATSCLLKKGELAGAWWLWFHEANSCLSPSLVQGRQSCLALSLMEDRARWLLTECEVWSRLFPVSYGLLRAVFGGTSQWLGVTSVKFFLVPYAFSAGDTTVECLEHSLPKPPHFILEAEMVQELPQGQRQRQDSNPELGAPGQAAEMFSKPTVAFPVCVHHSFSPSVWSYLVLLLHLGPGRWLCSMK